MSAAVETTKSENNHIKDEPNDEPTSTVTESNAATHSIIIPSISNSFTAQQTNGLPPPHQDSTPQPPSAEEAPPSQPPLLSNEDTFSITSEHTLTATAGGGLPKLAPGDRSSYHPPSKAKLSISREIQNVKHAGDTDTIAGEGNKLEQKQKRLVILQDLLAETLKHREKRGRMRLAAVRELFETESSYVGDLTVLDTVYIQPLQTNGVLTADQHRTIFGTIPALYHLNQNFQQSLKPKWEKWDQQTSCIGQDFLQFVPFFSMYQGYLNQHEEASALVSHLYKNQSSFRKFLDTSQMSSHCNGLDLKSYLVKPLQRVTKYTLLLREILKRTAAGDEEGIAKHPDYDDLKQAHDKIAKLNAKINEGMKEFDARQKVMAICQRITDTKIKLVAPARKFIKEGQLHKIGRREAKRYVFILFSDLLLYGDIVGNDNQIKVHNQLPIDHSFRVRDIPQNATYGTKCWEIHSPVKSFIVYADHPGLKHDWMQVFQLTIERRRTIRGQRKRAAPLWVPDDFTNVCMMDDCNHRFTFINRRHHCRYCGRLICGPCSSHKLPHFHNSRKNVRVCTLCFEDYKDMKKDTGNPQDEKEDHHHDESISVGSEVDFQYWSSEEDASINISKRESSFDEKMFDIDDTNRPSTSMNDGDIDIALLRAMQNQSIQEQTEHMDISPVNTPSGGNTPSASSQHIRSSLSMPQKAMAGASTACGSVPLSGGVPLTARRGSAYRTRLEVSVPGSGGSDQQHTRGRTRSRQHSKSISAISVHMQSVAETTRTSIFSTTAKVFRLMNRTPSRVSGTQPAMTLMSVSADAGNDCSPLPRGTLKKYASTQTLSTVLEPESTPPPSADPSSAFDVAHAQLSRGRSDSAIYSESGDIPLSPSKSRLSKRERMRLVGTGLLQICANTDRPELVSMRLQTFTEVIQWNLYPASMKPKVTDAHRCYLKAEYIVQQRNEILSIVIKDKAKMHSFEEILLSLSEYHADLDNDSDDTADPTTFDQQPSLSPSPSVSTPKPFAERAVSQPQSQYTTTLTQLDSNKKQKEGKRRNKSIGRAVRFLKASSVKNNVKPPDLVKFLQNKQMPIEDIRESFRQAGREDDLPELEDAAPYRRKTIHSSDLSAERNRIMNAQKPMGEVMYGQTSTSPETPSKPNHLRQSSTAEIWVPPGMELPDPENDRRLQRALVEYDYRYSLPNVSPDQLPSLDVERQLHPELYTSGKKLSLRVTGPTLAKGKSIDSYELDAPPSRNNSKKDKKKRGFKKTRHSYSVANKHENEAKLKNRSKQKRGTLHRFRKSLHFLKDES